MEADNPYRAPANLSASCLSKPHDEVSRFSLRYFVALLAVLTLNIFVPLRCAWMITPDTGRLGIIVGIGLGIFALVAVGLFLFRLSTDFGWSIVIGGLVTAVMQALPVLQFFAGFIGLAVAAATGNAHMDLENMSIPSVTSAVGCFIATFVSGGLIMCVAQVIGWFLLKLRSRKYSTLEFDSGV